MLDFFSMCDFPKKTINIEYRHDIKQVTSQHQRSEIIVKQKHREGKRMIINNNARLKKQKEKYFRKPTKIGKIYDENQSMLDRLI